MSTPPTSRRERAQLWHRVLLVAISLVALYFVALLYLAGQALVGSLVLFAAALFVYVYSSERATSYRYLFPGLAGMGLFVLLPLLFTVWMGFTNYSSRNLLTFERATEVLLDKRYRRGDERLTFQVVRDGSMFRLLLRSEKMSGDRLPSIFEPPGREPSGPSQLLIEPVEPAEPFPADWLLTEPIALAGADPVSVRATPLVDGQAPPADHLSMRELIALRPALAALTVELPGGATVIKAGLRTFAAEAPLYRREDGGGLRDRQTGVLWTPDDDIGFYTDEHGERLAPGYRVTVGFTHFARIFTDSTFQGPFLRIFLWTVIFAALSVLFTLIVGVLLGELLEWEELRFRGLYRILLFLPYAVPGFISILVFKGLFNENFGEINHILDSLFGVELSWFSDPVLAKIMLLVVNTWLGYPYIMLLWMGLRKSIPKDLYEASALAGAGPLQNFFQITWPLLKKPLIPLLVSSFAFNFNNFVLIALLTGGRPDFVDTSVPAGTTDILVSYTYRIAFQDSGQDFGLAAAVSTVIFGMVAILSLINLRLTKAGREATQ